MRLWHRFWKGFHGALAASWDRQVDALYRQHRLSSSKQRHWDDRIAAERAKEKRHSDALR